MAASIALTFIRSRPDNSARHNNDILPVWHEAPYFDERERAALSWAEALTHVSSTHAPDANYDLLCEYLSEKEIVDLSFAIAVTSAHLPVFGHNKAPCNALRRADVATTGRAYNASQ